MEQEQQVPEKNYRLDTCFFAEPCPQKGCSKCINKGLHYLAKRLYLPKTLIPLSYYELRFSDLTLSGESEEASFYLENIYRLVNEGKGFYAYSKGTGTGKTSVGCIALKHYLYWSLKANPYDTENRRVLYLNTSEFLDRLRKSFNRPDPELEGLMDELTNIDTAPKLILFDDLGAEKASEWVRERLYTLINFRASNGLASLYTSNESGEALINRLGSRVVSRVTGTTKPLFFGGRDRREGQW